MLDAQSGGRVLYATANLTVSNLTVQNGNVAGNNDGGGIYVTSGGSSLVLSNTVVQTNTHRTLRRRGVCGHWRRTVHRQHPVHRQHAAGSFGGGGVYFQNSMATPRALHHRRYVYGQHRVEWLEQWRGRAGLGGRRLLTRTTFLSNTVQNGGSGAVRIASSRSLTVTDSAFTNNRSVAGNGGALNTTGGSLITNTTFTGNTAVNGSGAYLSSATNPQQWVNVLLAASSSARARPFMW